MGGPAADVRTATASMALRADTDVFALARLLTSHGVAVTFAHDSGLSLQPTDVAALTWADAAQNGDSQEVRAQLTSTHMGLTGATSPLPQETLAALEEAMAADGGEGLTAWLADLQHRLLELLHQGVNGAQLATSAVTTLDDAMSTQLLSASSYAEHTLPKALRLVAHAVLSKPCCSASDTAWAVGRVLDHYGVQSPVRCTPMAGAQVPLEATMKWSLGEPHVRLGTTSVLGDSAFAPSGRVIVEVGPVSRAWVAACAPMWRTVTSHVYGMLRAAVPPHVVADVQLLLHEDALDVLRLRAPDVHPAAPEALTGLGANVYLGPVPKVQAVAWPKSA